MKTEKEILNMNQEELEDYKWSEDFSVKGNKSCYNCYNCYDCSNCHDCSNCYNCHDCYDCSNCYDCYDCYMCRNAKGLKYAICNVEVGKKAFEKKMKELGIKN